MKELPLALSTVPLHKTHSTVHLFVILQESSMFGYKIVIIEIKQHGLNN